MPTKLPKFPISAATLIRRELAKMPPGNVFVTRDVLHCGRRGAVDTFLWRMVKAGVIERLAFGVFRKYSSQQRSFTVLEIAKIKASAFGRKIFMHGIDAAHALGLIAQGNKEATFATDGANTSFRSVSGIIHLRHSPPKKISITGTKEGLFVQSIWALGHTLQPELMNTVLREQLRRDQRKNIYMAARWMPAWAARNICRPFGSFA